MAAGASGNPNLGELSFGEQVQVIHFLGFTCVASTLISAFAFQVSAQALYGYGYWGPFLLEFEEARLDCGEYDLVRV